MSKAVESPVVPCAMRYLKRWLVSSGEPKPANIRIVHSRLRYIVGWTPRVYGNCPGSPRSPRSSPARSAGVTTVGTGMPESVMNSVRRDGALAMLLATSARSQALFAEASCRTVAAS